MIKPSISAICVTYGRVAWLNESIACFLCQNYDGPKELIVLNTCPQQVLHGEFPNVRIFNLATRPASLGEARNIAIREAVGYCIITWDDDDIFLPGHLSAFAAAFEDNSTWVWMDRQFYAIGEDIKSIVPGSCPVFAFHKDAWEQAGGYPDKTCGEDRMFLSAVTTRWKGKKLPMDFPTFVYRWGNGVEHASGQGDDAAWMTTTARQRAQLDLNSRINRGIEKTGHLDIRPSIHLDWPAKANDFMGVKTGKPSENPPVCVVCLGRYGDIINILPICLHIHNTYGKPRLMVSKEFASLLEGVSYVEPYPITLDNSRLIDALDMAKRSFKRVLNCQIWGRGWYQEKTQDSYNRESWHVAGFGYRFGEPSIRWKPIFDKRDFAREEALWKQVNRSGKPVLLVNVTCGVSSPFTGGAALLQSIRIQFGERAEIVDLSQLKADRIYDVIGLMDSAAGLVSADTATLHLAAASVVPVIALVNPAPWLGTVCRYPARLRLTYDEHYLQPLRVLDELEELIERGNLDERCVVFRPEFICLETSPKRRVFHCVERHEETNTKDRRRKEAAQRSWDVLYNLKGVLPCHLWNYPRSGLDIGDYRALPYLKDVIKHGLDQAQDDDIVFWTNDDNFLHSDLPEYLQYHVSLYNVCCSQRCEFAEGPVPPGLRNPSDYAQAGRSHIGRDLVAATKRWWLKHWEELPDFLIGASDFDLMLACIVRLEFGIRTNRRNLEDHIFPAEIPRGYISHEAHAPKWHDPNNVNDAPSQKHNRRLFREWAATHLPELKFNEHNTI